MTDKTKSKLIIPILISLVTIFFASNLIIENYFISSIDNKLIDFHFNRRGQVKSKENFDVVIVGISNETLKELPPPDNQWPISRKLFAKAFSNLNEAGARVIGVDILFSEADRYDKINDSLLLYEIEKFNNVVLAAKLDVLDQRYISLEKSNLNIYNNYFYKGDDNLIGLVNVIPDFDGVIRRYYPRFYDVNNDKYLFSLAFSIFNKYLETIKSSDKNFGEKNKLFLDTSYFQEPSFIINYNGPSGTFTIIELINILDDKNFKTKTELELGEDINTWDDSLSGLKYSDIFKDKIVLFGSIEPEDKDIYPSPITGESSMQFGNLIYGVEIHANVIQMLIDGSKIHKVSNWILIFMILFFSFLSSYLFDFIKKLKLISVAFSEFINLILLILILFSLYELSFRLFHSNYFLTISSLFISTFSVYLSSLILHYLSERKQKLMIKNMFSHYVSSKIVEDLIENPQKLKLGGERKKLSILFSDIANFTSLSESIEPEILVDFMNDYFENMTEIIFKFNGTLDKFEGDAVMAFWNAPLSDPHHAENSLNTALEMKAKTKELNEKWFPILNFEIKTRIGVNTGEVIVGNMGSNKKFDFTVMGDNVNIAARLEALNKFYGTTIIASENTISLIRDKFIVRELDNLRVKGKIKPIKIFEVISTNNEEIKIDWKTIISEFEKGLYYYRRKDFIEAKKYFNNVLSIKANDLPSILYLNRCDDYIINPPDANWEGISEVLIK